MESSVASRFWPGHLPVVRRIKIRLGLRNIEPLRIGTQRNPAIELFKGVHNPILLSDTPQGPVPVIPGSSFKGVLRTATFIISRASGIKAHTGLGNDWCGSELASKLEDKRLAKFARIKEAAIKHGIIYDILRGFCPSCLLYGGSGLSGKVISGEFVPLDSSGVKIIRRTSIAIDRRKGTVAKQRTFSYEFVAPGAVFVGEIGLVNVPNWLLSLFAASLMYIHEGWLKLGGFKSRGMGRVEFHIPSLSFELWDSTGSRVDEEIDKDIGDLLSVCESRGNYYHCRGNDAYRVLSALAESWYKHYASLVKVKLEERWKHALDLLSYLAS